jgi:hypothetical protein
MASSCFRPFSRHNLFLQRKPSFSATACSWFMAIHFKESTKPTQIVRALISPEEGTFPILTGDYACGPQKFHPPLRAGNSESGHEKVSLLLEVSEVVIG